MIDNSKSKEKAIKMGMQGKIYKEIGKELGVHAQTICNWTRHIKLTPEQKMLIDSKRNK